MKNVTILPLAAPRDSPEEYLPYDDECFKDEEMQHETYREEIGESDPYLTQDSDVKRTYNNVMTNFLEDKNCPYKIKNWFLTDEPGEYKHYGEMAITITHLEKSLKEKEALPSRYTMYEFLNDYYLNLRMPDDAKTEEQIRAIYHHFQQSPPSQSLQLIWRSYYKIVNYFSATFLGRQGGSDKVLQQQDDDEYQNLVTIFISTLKQYKRFCDEFPENRSPEDITLYLQEYWRYLEESDPHAYESESE
jgi:hypothetical protein